MKEEEFKKLVNKEKYQVFLFSSNMPFPISFAVHTWFVINRKGKIFRFDFGHMGGSPDKKWGLVIRNTYPPTTGVISIMGMKVKATEHSKRNPSKLLEVIEGEEDSMADKMSKFILEKSKDYPHKDKYQKYAGANSNSFIQWIIDHFPESKFKLPFNAFGKKFKN